MKFHKCLAAVLVLVFVITSFTSMTSDAIPGFARRHKISCTTCHAPIPRLKPYGEEFAGNGFIIPEAEKERHYVSAGDDLLWLNRDFPIGVRFDAYAVYEENQFVDYDLQTPWGLKILSGGALYKKIGYYFYFYMSERGEVAGIEDAYIHFDDTFNTGLDIMVGQFQTSDPLMKRELRLTFEDYMIYKTRVGESGTNLAYDRGIMCTYGIQKTGTDLVVLVVNGNGKDEADANKKFDKDTYKNYGFRVSQGIGDRMSIGGYAYYGKERVLTLQENEIVYFGPDLKIGVGPVELTGQYLYRKDTNPEFLHAARKVETTGIVAELVYAPRPDSRHYFTLLYNQVDSDMDVFDYETGTIGATYLVARNLRLLAEYTRDLNNDLNRVVFGLVSGF